MFIPCGGVAEMVEPDALPVMSGPVQDQLVPPVAEMVIGSEQTSISIVTATLSGWVMVTGRLDCTQPVPSASTSTTYVLLSLGSGIVEKFPDGMSPESTTCAVALSMTR